MKNGGSLAKDYEMHISSPDYCEQPRLFRVRSLSPRGLYGYEPASEPFEFEIDLCIEEPDKSVKEPTFPSPSSFHTVSHIAPRTAQLYRDLDSFIMREFNVTPIESSKIRKDFLVTISERADRKETPTLEESATILKGLILAASKLGKTLQKEMSR